MSLSFSSAARYAVVGATNTFLYSGLLYLFLEHLKFSTLVSVTISYCVAMAFHFTMNRYYVFKADGKNIRQQLIRYLCFAACSYALSVLVVHVVRDVLLYSSVTTVFVNMVAAAVLGYLLSVFWVYK